ncbi:MAG TPA: phytase [Hyphomicrobiales bacterium]|nr:phytase [Hyphomicrobiales bacterium]
MRSVLALAMLAMSGGLLAAEAVLAPLAVTEAVRHDTDDPAIWVNPRDPAASLVLGTDKDADGALYVFDLQGRIQHDKVVRGLLRPNNVDIAYGVALGGEQVDVAVVTERYAHRLRVYRLPDMAPVDGGGIEVFAGERARDVMGVALYTRPGDGALFAIVSRSDAFAPTEGYLHQYRLVDDGTGQLRGVFTRAFGQWSGVKEIEAIAVDDALGYVYYSDENHAVRKYHADPLMEDADEQLAEFGLHDFSEDREGISLYARADGTGYLLVSDQQANRFNLYAREGSAGDPHHHALLASVTLGTDESDGSALVAQTLPGYAGGLFVAMSTDRTFQYYAVSDLLKAAGLPE